MSLRKELNDWDWGGPFPSRIVRDADEWIADYAAGDGSDPVLVIPSLVPAGAMGVIGLLRFSRGGRFLEDLHGALCELSAEIPLAMEDLLALGAPEIPVTDKDCRRQYHAATVAALSDLLNYPLAPGEIYHLSARQWAEGYDAKCQRIVRETPRTGDAGIALAMLRTVAESGYMVDRIRPILIRHGAYAPMTDTRDISWSDQTRTRHDTTPALAVENEGKITVFDGKDILGVLAIRSRRCHRNGTWSYTEYVLAIPATAVVWTVNRDGTLGRGSREAWDVAGRRVREWSRWEDRGEVPEAVVRALCPNTARRLDGLTVGV